MHGEALPVYRTKSGHNGIYPVIIGAGGSAAVMPVDSFNYSI